MSGDPPHKPAMRTVIGLAAVPVDPLAPPPAPPLAPAPPSAATPANPSFDESAPPSVGAGRIVGISGGGPVAPRHIPGTMMGMVSPVAQQASAKPSAQRTMMGVARPGIAPTHEASNAPPSSRAAPPLRAAPPFIAPPPPPAIAMASNPAQGSADGVAGSDLRGELADDRFTLPGVRRRSSPLLAVIVVALLAAALIITLLLVVFRAKPAPAVTAEVRGDGDARELLVSCPQCKDGSTLAHGDTNATFALGKAKIALKKEDVALGVNHVAVTIADGRQQWPMTLEVSIPFLVRVDLARLASGEESFDLVFTVIPQVTSIAIDGRATNPENGSATIAVPVTVATKDADRTFASTIAFDVKLGSDVRKGSLDVSLPYAALKVGLPGRNGVLLSNALLEVSGRTTAGAKVRLGADPQLVAIADATGIFHGQAKPASDDATSVTLQAFGEGLAPRRVEAVFLRATSLNKAIATLRAKVTAKLDQIATKPQDHLGEWVDVKMVVAKTGEEDGRTIAVGDAKCVVVEGGPRCPGVRILLPASSMLATPEVGASIEIIGVVVRAFPIEGGKATGTEIDASIALAQK